MTKTETTPLAERPDSGDHASDVCDACSHSLAAHDRIETRYCAATTAGGLDRGCLCGTA